MDSVVALPAEDAHRCSLLVDNCALQMYTQLGVVTKGTIVEVNVSELGLVTPGGKVVWGKYAQVRGWPSAWRSGGSCAGAQRLPCRAAAQGCTDACSVRCSVTDGQATSCHSGYV